MEEGIAFFPSIRGIDS